MVIYTYGQTAAVTNCRVVVCAGIFPAEPYTPWESAAVLRTKTDIMAIFFQNIRFPAPERHSILTNVHRQRHLKLLPLYPDSGCERATRRDGVT